MNNEVAIKIIKKRIDYLADARTYQNEKSDSYRDLTNEMKALLMANEALESKNEAEEYRKPKKIVHEVFEDDNGAISSFFACPTCGVSLYEFDTRRYVTYCRNCGQALDWTKEAENGKA